MPTLNDPLNSSLNQPLGEQTQLRLNGYLPLAGGTLTGTLVLAGDPASPPEAATKKYVDDQISAGGVPDAPANNIFYGRQNHAWVDLSLTFATIASVNTLIQNLQSQIDALNAALLQVQSDIAGLQQSVVNLDMRVTSLENTMPPSYNPFPIIGSMVHLRDENGHCQPAIVYEDWGGKNAYTYSVALLRPIRMMESPWDSLIEVNYETPESPPLTSWHYPEHALTLLETTNVGRSNGTNQPIAATASYLHPNYSRAIAGQVGGRG